MADGEELGQRIAALSARLDDDVAKRGGKRGRDGDGDGILNEGNAVSHALRHALSEENPLRHIGPKFQPGPTVPAAEALEALLSRPTPPVASELVEFGMSFEKGWVEWSKRQQASTAMEAFSKALSAANAGERASPLERVGKGLKGLWQSWMHPRAPKGAPDGGKFQQKAGSDAAPKPKVTWQHDAKWDGFKPKAGFDGPKPGAKWTGAHNIGARENHPLPEGAVKHPAVDNHGEEVWVKYPSKASPSVVWDDPEATATFTPGSLAPEVIQGIPTKLAYKPPQTAAEWTAVPGQNPEVEAIWPELVAPKGQHVGAGVIVQEDDGRVWIVSPTNGFGGYRQTFPKGTYEDDVPSLQANAIKEAFEESGLQVEITGVLGDFQRTTSVARMYLAKRVGGSPAHMGWESQAVRLAPVSTLRQWLNKGYIDHPIVDALEDLTGEWTAKAFDEAKHDRWPKGTPLGGQFKGMLLDMPAPPKIGWKKDGSGPGANATYYNQMAAAFNAAAQGDIGPATALYKKNFAIMDAFNPNVKTNSHTKWKAQVGQYAMELVFAHQQKGMAAQSAKVVEGKLGPLSIKDWKLVGKKPGGTAPGGLYQDETGQKWLVKGNLQGKDDARARNEVLASKLMQAAGIPAPEYKLVDLGDKYGGGLGVATKWEDGLKKVDNGPAWGAARQQFAVHAWLGNWDVVGVGGDNLLVRPNGEVVNIDPGGALLYRAQGMPKKALEFTTSAADWESMRDPSKNKDAAGLFGSMNATNLTDSAMLLSEVTDEQIDSLVDAYWVDTGSKSKNALASDLKGRRDMILMKAGIKGPGMTEPGEAPVKPPRAPSAKTADYAVKVPKVSKGGDADKMITALLKSDSVMGPPSKTAVPMLSMLANSWLTNAQNTAGKPQWDALQAATYAGQLLTFHDGQTTPMEQTASEMGSYLYGSQTDFAKAAAKYAGDTDGDLGEGVTAMAAGVSVVNPPSMDGMNPKITDMASVKTYKDIAFSVADAGGVPLPPDLGGMMAMDIQILQEWDKNWNTPKGPTPTSKNMMADGTMYGGQDVMPTAAAMSVYGQAIALKNGMDVPGANAVLNGVTNETVDAWDAAEAESFLSSQGEIGDDDMEADTQYPSAEGVAASTFGQEAAADTVKPAMPDFAAAKLDPSNSNAASHNAKVDLIAKLASIGNKSGILGLNYGTNTYGKKQAALANNALAALGSRHSVVPGQKKLSHPALSGNKANVEAVEGIEEVVEVVAAEPAKPKKVVITKADLPPPPKFEASKKAWKNAINKESVAAIEAAALEGNLTKLKNLTYPEHLDDEAGTLTGKNLPFSAHPSMKMQAYWSESMKAVDDKFNPPKPLVPAKTIKKAGLATIAKAFPTAPVLTTVQQMPANQRMGFWMALGQVDASREDLLPTVPLKDEVGSSFKASLSGAYAKSSPLSKSFMSSVQGSGGINDAYNQGKASYHNVGNLAEVNKALHADAVELPEGSTVYKWLRMEPNMQAALIAAPVGTVLQNPGSACNSMSPTNTSGFAGSDQSKRARIVYRAAKGAKMMPTWGRPQHGGFAGEQELTSLPGARMVLLGAKKVNGHFEIEVTLLPPHENSLKTKL